MQLNRQGIKKKAQEYIKISSPKTIYAGLIMLALGLIMGLLSGRMMGINLTETELLQYAQYVEDGNYEYAIRLLDSFEPSVLAYIINFALQIVYQVISAGFIIFLLNVIRNTGACMGNILDGFGIFFKVFLLNLLEGIFIFLWSLLLVVPGLIAAYRYRMAIYILIDNPDMSPLDCIRESKKMMKNHKAELLVFDLSFFGWFLLESIPYLGYLVQVWTIPYINMSYALYYEALRKMPVDAQFTDIPGSNTGNQTPPWEG